MNSDDFIVSAFRRQVEADPRAPCIAFADDTFTRERVWRAALRTASGLRAGGLEDRAVVAVHLPRSPELVVAMLGIAMAGGVYAPLDTRLPPGRLRQLLSLLAPQVLVSNDAGQLLDDSQGVRSFDVSMAGGSGDVTSGDLPVELAADQPAYVICTSGSTGVPKAVLVSHRALANYATWAIEHYQLHALEGACFSTGVGFDASLVTQLLPLLAGLPVTIAPEGEELQLLGRLLDPDRAWSGLLKLVPSQLDALAAALVPRHNPDSRCVFVLGGEPLSPRTLSPWLERFPESLFFNQYGPTEATIACSCHRIDKGDLEQPIIPIGRPIPNVTLTIVDASLAPLGPGETGEILISGEGLAEGYLRAGETENARFLRDDGGRITAYRSGDQAFVDEQGVFHFLGRNDDQVKLRGYRIELGEVRAQLAAWPLLASSTVALHQTDRIAQLVAFGVARQDGSGTPTVEGMTEFLGASLPAYMIPSRLVVLPELPLTTSGKADHAALLESLTRTAAPATHAEGELRRRIAAIWDDLLGCGTPGPKDSFFELGGDSIKAVQLAARVTEQLGIGLQAPQVFEVFRFGEFCELLGGAKRADARQEADMATAESVGQRSTPGAPIAIIGAAVDLPGAESLEVYWDNLLAGRESVTFFADDELDPRVRDAARYDDYVKARGVLETDASTFDAAFFGYSAREAALMDPQQRRFLEIAWQTLESGGYATGVPQHIGVFAGCAVDTYTMQNVIPRACGDGTLLDLRRQILNDKDYLPLRVSHKLNLTGPSLNINTACSTSLVAVATAVQALRLGQCDMALAGGASIDVPIRAGYRYTEGGMLSPDGHTRPFDRDAAGTVFNAGVGAVLLKPLDRALADGDPVLAVIKGVGISNDGADKASFAAPTVAGQRAAIETAMRDARVAPGDIAFVEAHGTATPIGDPIEIEALRQALGGGAPRERPCWIGSVKGNIGHAVAAAGVAGLLKAAMSLRDRTFPATANFVAPNPSMNLASSGFEIAARPVALTPKDGPLRCGVSSFGLGGTNAHVVLEEAPAVEPSGASPRPCELLPVSGRSEAALADNAGALAAWLERHPSADLADVAFTLASGRRAFEYCALVTAETRDQAIERLRAVSDQQRHPVQAAERAVFLFPGQGSQEPQMAAELYRSCAVYRSAFDDCAQIARHVAGLDLDSLVYGKQATAERLADTRFTQPALFAVEYALARCWLHWGLQPAAVIGHSIGEYVAACIAGVMSLEDALELVMERGRLLSGMPAGAMLSVRLDEQSLRRLLPDDLDIAAVNSSAHCVVSGPEVAVQRFAERLSADDVPCTRLHTSHAFHSRMMTAALEPFGEAFAGVDLKPPAIPFVTTARSGGADALTPDTAAYWVNQIAATVQFADAVREAAGSGPTLFLEVGPRRVLTQLAPGCIENFSRAHRGVASLAGGRDDDSDWSSVLHCAGTAWASGLPFDWKRFYAGERRRRLSLPGYRFQRERYWIDAAPGQKAGRVDAPQPAQTDPAASSKEPSVNRETLLAEQVRNVFRDHTGLKLSAADDATDFFELGLDSLFLTQAAGQLSRTFDVTISFRQLTQSESSVGALARFLDETLPEDAVEMPASGQVAPDPAVSGGVPGGVPGDVPAPGAVAPPMHPLATGGDLASLIQNQMAIMQQQLALLSGTPTAQTSPGSAAPGQAAAGNTEQQRAAEKTRPQDGGAERPAEASIGPATRIQRKRPEPIDADQQAFVDDFTERYCARLAESKRQAQLHRKYFADPRTVSGFSPALKELVFPIVVERSDGAYLHDVDGNRYIDLLNGFGSNFFGHNSPFIREAMIEQLERGIQVGPQTPLAGAVARQFCEITGMERVAFCNTGSEAVVGAIRLARTVTGRDRVAMFSGSYHGINDNVIARAGIDERALPASPGIPQSAVDDMLVLPYGEAASLDLLRAHGKELAAIIVEPVQSRHPDLQPREFLQALRGVADEIGCPLIFDEVITGFRTGPRGAQAVFGVEADIATYGKVVGGGVSLGVIAGKASYLDALDGGQWSFGDDSVPEVGVTFFAGTFVRHPQAMAAAKAVLDRIEVEGEALAAGLDEVSRGFVDRLQSLFDRYEPHYDIERFSSMFLIKPPAEMPLPGLLFCLLRHAGIHILESRPCFLTLAHTGEDLDEIVAAFDRVLRTLAKHGFLLECEHPGHDADQPPVPGARLGRDPEGNPAWYVEDEERPGEYRKLEPA